MKKFRIILLILVIALLAVGIISFMINDYSTFDEAWNYGQSKESVNNIWKYPIYDFFYTFEYYSDRLKQDIINFNDIFKEYR